MKQQTAVLIDVLALTRLSVVILLAAAFSTVNASDLSRINSPRVQQVAVAEASRLPAPRPALSSYARFELAPLVLSPEVQADNAKVKRAAELERKLRAKLVPLLQQWTGANDENASGRLVIRPRLDKLRIVSAGATFFIGYTGNSFIDMELELVDATSEEMISAVPIHRSSNQDTQFSLSNSRNELVIDFVVAIAHQYFRLNGKSIESSALASSSSDQPSLKSLFDGKIRSGKTRKKNQYHVFHALDGTMQGITLTRYSEYHDKGTWEINESGQFCAQWDKWLDGKRYCYIVTALGGTQYMATNPAGQNEWFFELQQGDPRKLGIKAGEPANSTVNLTGTFISETTGTDRGTFLAKYTGGKVYLVQTGNKIEGTYGDNGQISGEIDGNTIRFDWWGEGSISGGPGIWKIGAQGNELTGTWTNAGRHYSGTWNLKKIE